MSLTPVHEPSIPEMERSTNAPGDPGVTLANYFKEPRIKPFFSLPFETFFRYFIMMESRVEDRPSDRQELVEWISGASSALW